MRSLLYKEFSMLPVSLLLFPIMLWVLCMDDGGKNIGTPSMIIMGGYIMLLMDYRRRGKTITMMSLPVTRFEILFSKYIASMIMGGAVIGILFILNETAGFFFNIHAHIPVLYICIGFLVAIVISIPFHCREFSIWLSVLCYGICFGIFSGFVSVINQLGYSSWLFWSLFFVGALLISWSISYTLYKKMEF